MLAVTGEPGIGKTRLMRDVVDEANGRITVLHGTGASYASGFPLWPLRDMLRRWLDMSVGASEAQVRLELKARLAELYGEPGERYVFLASVLGLSPEPGEPDRVLGELSRENVQSRTVEVVGGLLASLAEQRPVLLVLDDLHWADAATLTLLEGLLEVTEAASLGVAMLYRSERDSGAWRLAERARARFPHRFREVELRAAGHRRRNPRRDRDGRRRAARQRRPARRRAGRREPLLRAGGRARPARAGGRRPQ